MPGEPQDEPPTGADRPDETRPSDAAAPSPPQTLPSDIPTLAYAAPSLPGPRVLGYAAPMGGDLVTVARCTTPEEAELQAGVLESAGIVYHIINANSVSTLSLYAVGFGMRVEVQVREEDARRAAELLANATSDDLEPIDEREEPPPVDEAGAPVVAVVAAAFDTPRAMREAAAALASARLRVYVPTLVPRDDRPKREGNRFKLRVAEADLARAQEVLDETQAEADDDDEPRCPKCRSWRTYPVTDGPIKYLSQMLGLRRKAMQIECLACRYRGPRAEFEGRSLKKRDEEKTKRE